MPEQPCILLAEDSEGIRRFMTVILSAQGYRVLPAENGRVALTLFRKHRNSIKMLITDLSMPEMTGTELIAEVRKIVPALPVLVCSSSIHPGEKYLTNDIRCIEKPFALDAFTRTVGEMWRTSPAANTLPTRRRRPRPRLVEQVADHEAPTPAGKPPRQLLRPPYSPARHVGVLAAAAAILCASVWAVAHLPTLNLRKWTLPATLRSHLQQIPISIESAVKAWR